VVYVVVVNILLQIKECHYEDVTMGWVYTACMIALGMAIVAVLAITLSMGYRNQLNLTSGSMKAFSINLGGTQQFTCPVGTHINVITGITEVYDPYGQCTASANVSPNKDYLESLYQQDQTSTNPKTHFSDNMNNPKNGDYQNKVCGPPAGANNQFRTRDVTAQLGMQLNGQNSATLSWDESSNIPFPGPDPSSSVTASNLYKQLPLYPGNSGYDPSQHGGQGSPVQSTTYQGYVFYGVYTCVPDY